MERTALTFTQPNAAKILIELGLTQRFLWMSSIKALDDMFTDYIGMYTFWTLPFVPAYCHVTKLLGVFTNTLGTKSQRSLGLGPVGVSR